MASENGSESPEASGQPPAYYDKEMERVIAEVQKTDITDDGLWYTLRAVMEGWREEDIK
ncbi:MAG: hypothetical protein SEPTF4163_005089, partial [Sporothrix epigloea]